MTLKEIEKRWPFIFKSGLIYPRVTMFDTIINANKDIDWLISRVKELKEGIKKHQDIIGMSESKADRELYKLLH